MPLPIPTEQRQSWLWLALAVLLLVLLWMLGPVLAPFIAGAILAYMLNPAVDALSRLSLGKRYVPRALSASIVILLLAGILLGVLLIVVPVLQREIGLLRDAIPAMLARLDGLLAPRLRDLGLDISLDFASLQKLLTEQLSGSGEQIATALLASAKIGGTAVLGWLATVVLVPVVLFYLLMDWHSLIARAAGAVPRRWAAKVEELAHETDSLLAQYLRGQLAVMLALALYYTVGLSLVRLDVALPVGLLTGLLSFIPYVGFGLGLTLALLAALLQFGGLYGIVLVAVVYGIGQVLESFILTPRLVGERIGLSPLIVIFALLAFGQLFGFTGVLLALPATAILSVAARHLYRAYHASTFYRQP